MSLSSITHLNALQSDALAAIQSVETGPEDLFRHDAIIDALEEAGGAFPPIYERAMRLPLLNTFRSLGPDGWAGVLDSDPRIERAARLGLDLTQAIVQRADPDIETASLAFQEVISDLYDGYLGAADRTGVKAPDHSVLAPLVKWGQPRSGPYVWPAPATAGYGCSAGVVSMPPAFASGGLVAWSALAHEGGGHAILHADIGLHTELAEKVHDKIWKSKDKQLADNKIRKALAVYWSEKIDETASDVLGVLNMGPAAAIGMIAYFRALRREGKLLPFDTGSPHPTDIARGYLVAAAVGHCEFDHNNDWRKLLTEEVDLDVPDGHVWLGGAMYSKDVVRDTANLAALAIMNDRIAALENHRITEIQNWTNDDNRIVQLLGTQVFMGGHALPPVLHDGVYAAHGVSAAIMVSLLDGRARAHQARMVEMLGAMHRSNVAWTGLEFAHSGALLPQHAPHFATIAEIDPTIDAAHESSKSVGSVAMGRMAMLGLTYGMDAAKAAANDVPGSDINIPFGFASDTPASFGSDIVIPFGYGARRHGLKVRNGDWAVDEKGAEVPLHEGLTPDILNLILGKLR